MSNASFEPSIPHQAGTGSALALCLRSLTNEGRAVVADGLSNTNDEDAVALLEGMDGQARAHHGLPLPSFSPAAGLWGARLFHQLCRFVVRREIAEAEIRAGGGTPFPEARGPSADWSVDLTLHHLPRLFELARRLSNADPLVEQMKRIAQAWPLSSVGIGGLGNLDLDSLAGDPGLLRLYADRIIAAGDLSRLGDARVDNLLRADLGVHRELAPGLAARLFETAHDSH